MVSNYCFKRVNGLYGLLIPRGKRTEKPKNSFPFFLRMSITIVVLIFVYPLVSCIISFFGYLEFVHSFSLRNGMVQAVVGSIRDFD